MQAIKYRYLLCLFGLAGLASCSKSFLNLNPVDELSTGNFWKTTSDAQLGLTGCYNTLQNGYFSMHYYPDWDNVTDDAFDYNNRVGGKDLAQPLTSQTGGIFTGFYGDAYTEIAVYNYFLANVGKVDASVADIGEWKSEVLFLRALYYFYLTEFYGDVPMILTPYTVGDPTLAKTHKTAVLTQIENDLDTAITYLPATAYTSGHVVQADAQFLEAEIFLNNNQYAQAAALCHQIMQSGLFQLYPDYYSMYLSKGQGSSNTEIMFSVQYLSPNNENISSLQYGWWMDCLPLQNMVDEYECTDGLAISQSPLYNPASPYTNRDPRLNASIVVPGSWNGFPGEGQPWWKDRIQYLPIPCQYNLRKYVDSSMADVSTANHCENACILYRYADVLLTYAEAQNEATGPDASVYAALNQVRARPSVNMPPLQAGLSQSDMLTRIQHERRVEMAFEGHRWTDLKRWGLSMEKIGAIGTTQVPTAYVFSANNVLWPFPQGEMDYYTAHSATLGQNPGY